MLDNIHSIDYRVWTIEYTHLRFLRIQHGLFIIVYRKIFDEVIIY